MRVMTYNIYEGGGKRIEKIIEVVKNALPDYLTINEANTFAKDSNALLKFFAQQTGFPYFDIALSGQQEYHVAVFSKYPFKQIHKLQPLARACLVALIDSPLGELSIANLHLSPFSEDARHQEIDMILRYQNKYSKRILMGDMNALAQADNYDEEMVKNFNEYYRKRFTTNGRLRFDAISKIVSSGYTDAAFLMGKNKTPTIPTPISKYISLGEMRLDYIFVSKPLVPHIISYEVIRNKLTDTASDHYPVTVELV